MTTTLLIARHGNTFSPGETVRRVGTTDLPLSPGGREQGQKLGKYLRECDLIPDAIFTSRLQRTVQTAEEAQKSMHTRLPMTSLDIFDEIDYGPDENQPEDAVIARLGHDALNAWEQHATVPDGWKVDPQAIIRHWNTFAAMIIEKFSNQTVLVVTSNGIARFAPHLTGDFDAFCATFPIKIATGALCMLEHTVPDTAWTCPGWNIRPQGL